MEVNGSRYKQEDESILLKTLFLRAATGDIDALNNYLMRNGSINRRDEDGMALIHHAACHGDIRLIQQLGQYGAQVDLLDDGAPPWKPVHYAIFHRQHEAEKLLIALGAQVPLSIVKHVILEKQRVGHGITPSVETLGTKRRGDRPRHGAVAIQPERITTDRRSEPMRFSDTFEAGVTR